MKKWFYFIVPAAMLLVFSFFYLAHAKDAEIQEQQRKEQIVLEKNKEADRKAAIEEQARLDATKHAAQRETAAALKEAERLAKWEEEGREIQQTTDQYKREADQNAKKASALELELDTLHKLKEQTNSEVLALAKQVEQERINKRNAELEIQRKTENVVRRAESSAMTQMPVTLPISSRR
jgi:hypothetical protein|uniref:hypothetical protein n=1 Tax=Cephaloticoccus sp. TaxID=1985742 RepID=UPI00404A89D4